MNSQHDEVKTFGNPKQKLCEDKSLAKAKALKSRIIRAKNLLGRKKSCGFESVSEEDGFIRCGDFKLRATSVNEIVNILRQEKTFQEKEIDGERAFNLACDEVERDVAFAFDLEELKEFGGKMRDDCDACCFLKKKLIERDPIYLTDVPVRDNNWVQAHACNESIHDVNCPVFGIDDFKWAKVQGKPSPGFMRNCRDHLNGALFSLKFDSSNEDLLELFKGHGFKPISKKQRKAVQKSVRSNPYVIFMTLSKDCVFGDYEQNGLFFRNLYDLREQLGLNGDYGYKVKVENSEVAEADEPDAPNFSMTDILRKLKEKTSVCWKSIREIADWLCNIIIGGFTGFSAFVSEAIKRFVDNFKKFAAKILLRLVVPDDILKQEKSEKFTAATIAAMTVMIVTLIGIAGFVGTKLAISLIKKVSNSSTDEEILEGEADTSVLQILTGFSLWGIGVHRNQCKTIRDHALLLTACMAGGSVVNNTLCHLFTLLPSTIRAALTYKFGTEDDKLRYEVHNWRSQALALVTGSRVSSIVSSKFFKTKVEETMCSGQKLLYKLSQRDRLDLKNAFVAVYFKLFNVSTVLLKMEMNAGTRKLPWSFHFAALPGRGKSLVIEPLIRRLTGCDEGEIFYRPVGEEHWGGYAGQKIVIYDEFLIGNDEVKDKISLEYIALNSVNQFMPPMASVDDASVGIKGTIAEPNIVVTINNSIYDRPRCVPVLALQRRRDCVIEMEHASEFYGEKGQVDLSKYTVEEIANFEHAVFRIHCPVAEYNVEPTEWMKYDKLVEMLANRMEQHEDNCAKVASALGGGMETGESAEAKFQEIMRRNFGLPTKPMEVTDAISEFLGIAMQAEMETNEFTVVQSRKKLKNKRKKLAKKKLLGEKEEEKTEEIVRSVLSNILDSTIEDETIPPEPRNLMKENREKYLEDAYQNYVDKVKLVKSVEESASEGENFESCKSEDTDSVISYDDIAWKLGSDLQKLVDTYDMQKEFVNRLRAAKSQGYLCDLPDDVAVVGCLTKQMRSYLNTDVCYRESMSARTILRCANPKCGLIGLVDDPKGGVFICHECDGERNAKYGLIPHGEVHFDVAAWEARSLDMLLKHGRQGLAFHMANGLTFENIAKGSAISAATVVGIGFLTCCAITTMNYFKGKLFDKKKTEITFGPESAKPKPKSSVARKTYVPTRIMKAQKGAPTIHRNFVLKWGETGQRRFNAIPVKGRFFLTYAHVFQCGEIPFDQPVKLCLEENFGDPWKEIVCDFDVSKLALIEEDDLAMFEFTGKCSEVPNILKKFVDRNTLTNSNNIQATIRDGNKTIHINARLGQNLSYHTTDRMYCLNECWKYEALTEPGDCGLPLVPFAGPLVHKIIGLHVAGSYIKDTNSKGMATLIPREAVDSLLEYLGDKPEKVVLETFVAEASDLITDEDLGRPNVLKIEKISRAEEIKISERTKITPSFLNNCLSVDPKKEPAILSVKDPRAKGIDPRRNVLEKMFDNVNMPIDEEVLDEVYDEMFEECNKDLIFPVGRRELTFEEACGGIPGFLCSITTQTSPGWPLIYHKRRKGKTDFVWFEGSELHYTPEFRHLVFKFLEEMESYSGNRDDLCRFLFYLKDEVLKKKKIVEVNTRATFCNNMIAIVAFRMKFGCILAAFSSSGEIVPDAIGLNPNSFDMNKIYAQLRVVGENFMDGDFGKFDLNFQKLFQGKSYELLMRLAKTYGVSDNACRFFVDHETVSPIQIACYLVWLECLNRSGCFFTTISNDKVGEGYIRYVIKKLYRDLIFRQHCRTKHQGDDHILNVSDHLKSLGFTPKLLQEKMKEWLHQQYTPAQKDEEFGTEFKKFSEIMFLGSHPIMLKGKYTGALRKETIWEMVQWTRDENLTIDQTVQSAIEQASQWGSKFYYDFVHEVTQCYEANNKEMIPVLPYSTCSYIVSNRTTDNSGSTYYNMCHELMVAEMDSAYEFNPNSITVSGLTTIKTMNQNDSSEAQNVRMVGRESLGLNEQIMNLDYGQESIVNRTSVSWPSTSAAGANLLAIDIPFGLLALGNSSNIQNMAWERFIYAVTEVELILQVNGTPTQQGVVIAYFRPLSSASVGIVNKPSFDHTFLMPNVNTTATLKVPFRFWRHALNTYAGALGEETLGSFRIDVMTPLITDAATDCFISVYSRFKTDFRIARPVVPAGTAVVFGPTGEKKEVFMAEGATYSTSNVANTYTISSIAGDVPIQGNGARTDQQLNPSASVSGIPLDNPPISGCSVPIHKAFSSMSKVVGLEPTVSLQANQKMLHREQLMFRDPAESTIAEICGKRGYLLSVNWSVSDAVGAVKFNFPLNSVLTTIGPMASAGTSLPSNLGLLNQFERWRADMVFEFLCARTKFHSGRLRFCTAYGAPSIGAGEENIFLNTVMEFNDDNFWQTVRVPFNAATEFLRTWDGTMAPDQVQDYSLGQVNVTVANRLRSTSTVVANNVNILMFVRLENVHVYEPKLVGSLSFASQGEPIFIGDSVMLAEAGEVVSDTPALGDEQTNTVVDQTASETNVQADRHCQLDIGRKFEYCITDIHEIFRRHTLLPASFYTSKTVKVAGVDTYTVYQIPVRPFWFGNDLFAAWSGHLKNRIFVNTATPCPVLYDPHPLPVGINGLNTAAFTADVGHQISTWNAGTSVHRSSIAILPGAVEMTFPVSSGTSMIDVSTPFNSHYNFLPTVSGPSNMANGNGTLFVRTPLNSKIEVFVAAGDDFRYEVFYPRDDCTTQIASIGGAGVTPVGVPNIEVAGFMM